MDYPKRVTALPREPWRVDAEQRCMRVKNFRNPAAAGIIAEITMQTLCSVSDERVPGAEQ